MPEGCTRSRIRGSISEGSEHDKHRDGGIKGRMAVCADQDRGPLPITLHVLHHEDELCDTPRRLGLSI